MPTSSGISNHTYKLTDFVFRVANILLISLGLVITHLCFSLEWQQSSSLLLLFSIVFYQLAASHSGIADSQRSISLQQQLTQTLLALGGTFILVVMASGLSNRMHSLATRPFLALWFLIDAVLLLAWAAIVRKSIGFFRTLGFNRRSTAIVGTGDLGRSLAERFCRHAWMGIDVQGFYDIAPNEHVDHIDAVPVLGDLDRLLQDARSGRFDRVYITLPLSAEPQIRMLVDGLSDSTTSVFLVPDVFIFDLLNSRQTSIDGLPAISIYDTPFTFSDSVLKRGFDIFGSLAILSVIALPMLVIAAAVRLTSKGPAIFKQIRYGLDGKPIEVWKFRSMTVMDNGNVVKQATKGDARITPLGAFLRRTSLDELPQFINVLQGQMSIVGPRPHAVAHNEEYRRLIKGYMLRHKVKPGITGWAQINGWRGETDTLEKMENRVRYDIDYIRHWSIWLDVKIVFLTVFKGFVSKNAY